MSHDPGWEAVTAELGLPRVRMVTVVWDPDSDELRVEHDGNVMEAAGMLQNGLERLMADGPAFR